MIMHIIIHLIIIPLSIGFNGLMHKESITMIAPIIHLRIVNNKLMKLPLQIRNNMYKHHYLKMHKLRNL